MKKVIIKPFNVIDMSRLPEIESDHALTEGDPLEINGEMFYVCERNTGSKNDPQELGLIPLVVRDPAKVKNIQSYINCLSIAHRKVRFKNEKGECDLQNCNEMIID